MVLFETTKERHVNGIVATLDALYDGKPVTSTQIGKAYGMNYHQVLIYLHKAKLARRATPVYTDVGGIIRGWMPGTAGKPSLIMDDRAKHATQVLKELFDGEPVPFNTILKQIGKHKSTV